MTTFSDPVVAHTTSTPTSSLIFLHGRGDTSKNFAFFFFSSPTSSSLALGELLGPHTRIVFPTCLPVVSPTYGTSFPQWFDIYHDSSAFSVGGREGGLYSQHQLQSLKECVEYIHGVIEAEIQAGVPEERIWVGGLSQGMGAAAAAVLAGRWKLGGLVGMSGWMPFCADVRREISGGREMEVPDVRELPFPAAEDDEDPVLEYGLSLERRVEIMRKHRRDIGLPELPGAEEEDAIRKVLQIPVFIGHGDGDTVVRYQVGRWVLKAMKGLGMEVVWKRYHGLGHWWSAPDEIDDMITFMVDGGLELGHDEEVRGWFLSRKRREEVEKAKRELEEREKE